MRHLSLSIVCLLPTLLFAADPMPTDIVVSSDGSAQFTSIQKALASIPKDSSQRVAISIKDGVYKEKLRIDSPNVTLRGQSRKNTRIEFPQLNDEFAKNPDPIGRAVVNINADDCTIENLTITNTAGIVGPHSFAIYGTGDRTAILDCDVLSEGADTVSLWRGKDGHYYHARCNFRGAVDFVCPRGWCYITDCTFYETKSGSAAIWHDGSKDKDQKFVLRNCKFDGVEGWQLARHHHDAQFFLLNCTFSKTLADRAPYRVIYPLNHGEASDADKARNAELDKTNIWGERFYFYNCHREGGDYGWIKNNIETAEGHPKPEQITAAWTFDGKWDPQKELDAKARRVDLNVKPGLAGSAGVILATNLAADAPPIKIVLIGDSTVNDGGGWGKGFKKFLNENATCVNLAQNGRSSKSFLNEGWWKKALAEKPNYVLIQFGHNDQPGKGPERETDPNTTFKEYLARYIDDSKAIGAKPILVTSLSRRSFKNGKIVSTLTPWADAAKALAAEKNIPVIDLHARSIELLEKIGPKASEEFDAAPTKAADGSIKPDKTHLSAKGQEVFGKMMAEELKKAQPALEPYVK